MKVRPEYSTGIDTNLIPTSRTISRTVEVQATLAQGGADVHDPDYGATGDGSDDSAAFTLALATGETVILDGSKTYAIKDINLTASHRIEGHGARVTPVSGAKYLFRMSGFRPEIHNLEITDADDVLTVSTTLSGAEAAAQTVLSVTSVTSLEVGMLVMIEMDVQSGHESIPRWHISPITAVGASTITIERGLEADAASGNSVKASWGAINVKGANRYVLKGIAGVNTSWGIYLDADKDNGDTENVRGVLDDIQLMNVRHVGIFSGRDTADTIYGKIHVQGGNAVTDNYTGDGSTTSFDVTTPVWRTLHLTTTIDGVAETGFTFTDNDTIDFTSSPGDGDAIVLTHSERAKVCFMMDASGFVTIRGGDQIEQLVCLGGLRGIALHAKELTTFEEIISDTISGEALLIDDVSSQLEFGSTILSFCHQPLKVDGSSITSLTIGGPVRTKLAGTSTIVSGAVATEAINIGSSSRLRLNAANWTDDSNFTDAGSGDLVLTGTEQIYTASSSTVAAGSTVFFGPEGQTATEIQFFVAPRRMIFLKLIAQSGAAPGASETFVSTLRKNGNDTAIVATISGAGVFADTATGAVVLGEGDTFDIELVTSGSASVTRHRMVMVAI